MKIGVGYTGIHQQVEDVPGLPFGYVKNIVNTVNGRVPGKLDGTILAGAILFRQQ